MDRLRERLTVAERALERLRELMPLPEPKPVERDAAIKRFEYSVEATWKTAQQFLRAVEGIEVGSPKGAIRASHDAGLLSDADVSPALAMIDDRNLATHTYDEELAKSLFARLPGHQTLLDRWLSAMAGRIEPKT